MPTLKEAKHHYNTWTRTLLKKEPRKDLDMGVWIDSDEPRLIGEKWALRFCFNSAGHICAKIGSPQGEL